MEILKDLEPTKRVKVQIGKYKIDYFKEPFPLGGSEEQLEAWMKREKARTLVSLKTGQVYLGDCREVLKTFPDSCIDLIVTSPPYAENRKTTYGGIPPAKYVEWFLPISTELKRVLKPDGSFVLNVKERVVGGQRGLYIYELVTKMVREQGWLWTEEYIWHKKNTYPGKWPNRFRDLWEHCYHFTKAKKFRMYQDAVMVQIGEWAERRLKSLNGNDLIRYESATKSGFGKNISNWKGRELVYPGNVLHLATESSNKKHSATFPVDLPSWFIKLLSKHGDVVLDPFMGSGTTAVASLRLGRKWVGIENGPVYFKQSAERIAEEELRQAALGWMQAASPWSDNLLRVKLLKEGEGEK